ncbi:hypothetical protein [Uliginosibacterium sp. 31-12]|uniref:hypothetical protein n=1 Tax=Uliginosibacterium sp. 31-12 TaxID=3062781 RepID=UPI0026E1EC18|nr:hypothetical protein [Uliginosibacterium sp. 31-12]MDO6385272.1 hypothetical protein [Uliginosibacterium sp. 31-12]
MAQTMTKAEMAQHLQHLEYALAESLNTEQHLVAELRHYQTLAEHYKQHAQGWKDMTQQYRAVAEAMNADLERLHTAKKEGC